MKKKADSVKKTTNKVTIWGENSGTVNQNCVNKNIVIQDPARAVLEVKDDPKQLKFMMDQVARATEKSELLPEGYSVSVTMQNGEANIVSRPDSEEAAAKYPQRIVGKFKIAENVEENMTLRELYNRATLMQKPIKIDMVSMEKMIGDQVDPYQDAFQKEWRNSIFQIAPGKLPSFQCRIEIAGEPIFYDDVVLSMMPVNIKGDELVSMLTFSNEKDQSELKIELQYDPYKQNETLNYKYGGTTWEGYLKFLRFMKQAACGKKFAIINKETGEEIFAAEMNRPLYGENYSDIDSYIDFIRDLQLVQAQFGCMFPFDIYEEADMDDIKFLADSIRGKETAFVWDSFSIKGKWKYNEAFPLEKLSEDPARPTMEFAYSEIGDFTIHGVSIPSVEIRYNMGMCVLEHWDELMRRIESVLQSNEDGSSESSVMEMTLHPAQEPGVGHRIAVVDILL